MARYEHLPIYKKAMDLAVYLEKIVRNFSRYHKYTFGTELRAKSREIVGVTIAANSRVEKLALLLELREKLEGCRWCCESARRSAPSTASARMHIPRISFGVYSLQQPIAASTSRPHSASET